MKVIIVSNNQQHVDAYRAVLGNSYGPHTFDYQCKDIREVEATAFVSPANCKGDMNGGIDLVYEKMFPGIEREVKSYIEFYEDDLTIEVGMAVRFQVERAPRTGLGCGRYLIFCPTMPVPGSIKSNPEYVSQAAFGLFSNLPEWEEIIDVLAVPCFGTGVGEMNPKISALLFKDGMVCGIDRTECYQHFMKHK